MARVLIVGGEQRGWGLGRALAASGCAVRVVVDESRAGAVGDRPETVDAAQGPPAGVERWPGDARRLASLRGALANITVACWLFGEGWRDPADARALHGPLLDAFLRELLDSPARGLLYELPRVSGRELGGLRQDARWLTASFASRHALGLAVLDAGPTDAGRWHEAALADVQRLLTDPG